MNEITIDEVVKFHMKCNNYKNIDELINMVVLNLEELAKKEIAMQIGATCLYSCFTESCDFCGQCIGEEFNTFEDILSAGDNHQENINMQLSQQYEMHGHPI